MVSSIYQKLQASISFFNNFTVGEVELFIKSSPRKTYPKNDYIYRQGSVGNELYVIINGRVRLNEFSSGIVYHSKILKYGDIFGMGGFVLNKQREEDAISYDDQTAVIIINEYHITRNLSVAYRFYRYLSIELSLETRDKSDKITQFTVEGGKKVNKNKLLIEKIQSKDPNLKNSIISQNNFLNYTFTNLNFVQSYFNFCEFSMTTFNQCDIKNSNWSKGIISKTTIRNCVFNDSDLTATQFNSVYFVDCTFNSLNLVGTEVDSEFL